MRSPNLRLPVAVLVAALAAAGCGTAARVSAGTSTRAPATARPMVPRGSTKPGRPARASVTTPAAVAATFAAAYARYLDGQLPAAALPDLGAGALRDIGPPIPRLARRGELTVQPVKQAPGAPAFAVGLRDRAHTFPLELMVGMVAGRWLVMGIAAPDIDTILHSQSIPIPQPPGSGPAEQAARTFLAGYLPWLYGAGPAVAIRAATSQLTAQLKAHPPTIPPTFQGLHGRLDSLGMQRAADGWRAFALVTDPHTSCNLVLSVEPAGGRWLVASVGLAR